MKKHVHKRLAENCFTVFLTLVLSVFVMAETLVDGFVNVHRVDVPPVIDGDLEDEAWEKVRWEGGFVRLGDGSEAEVETRFKIVHDNHYIYFAVEAMEPLTGEIRARATDAGDSVFRDDCVEIFLDPNRHQTEYYHFAVNSLGTIYDSKVLQAGHIHDSLWESGIRAESRVLEDRWCVELAIPLVSLELEPVSEKGWSFNIARERYAGGVQELTTYAAVDGFHRPDQFSTLNMEDFSVSDYMWEFSPLVGESLVTENGCVFYEAEFLIKNNTGRLRLTQILVELVSAVTGDREIYSGMELINSGQVARTRFKVKVPESGDNLLRILVNDYNDPSARLAMRSYPRNLVYNPLEMDVISPPYRNNIYSTQQIDAIAGEVRINLPDEEILGKTLVLRLLGKETGRVVEETVKSGVGRREKFSLPVRGLEVGDYSLEASLREPASGEVVYSFSERIRKLPPPESGNEVWFDEKGACYVNGEPFLPVGFFGYPNHESFNTVQRYHFITPEIMDLYDAGIMLLAPPYLTYGDRRAAGVRYNPDRLLTKEELGVTGKAVEALREHSALLAWYLEDEPSGSRVIPERVFQAYDLIRETDPYHPVVLLDHTVSGQHRYAHCADILMPDPYPGFIRGGRAARSIDMITTFIKAAREATGGRNPVWFTPQWFSWWVYRYETQPNQREPDLRELRNMNYQAVIQGAKGIVGYTVRGWRHYPDFRLGLPFLAQELKLLKGAVLAGESEGMVAFSTSGAEDKFFWSSREFEGEKYIFAVNTATEKITVSGVMDCGFSGRLYSVSEKTFVEVAEGRFEDVFDVYDSRVYTTDAEVADALSFRDMEREIALLRLKIGPRKGDLALYERGVKASASSQGLRSNPVFAVDGIYSLEEHVDITAGNDAMFGFLYHYLYWSAENGGNPDWFMLEFPDVETISRVVVGTPNISEFTVQVIENGRWRDLSSVSGNRKSRAEVMLPEPVRASALRLYITGTYPEDTPSIIGEVEVYSE